MIPKIIHQTWKTRSLSGRYQRHQDTWKRLNPDWAHRFYDDRGCLDFIQSRCPEWLPVYERCPLPVMRADLFRCLAVFYEGGLYADTDMECLRPHGPLLEGWECVFGVETVLSPGQARRLGHVHAERIANCIFASEKGHPVLAAILDRVKANSLSPNFGKNVLEDTGPGALTPVVQSLRDAHRIRVLPQICWLPPTRPMYPFIFPFSLHMHARHHFAGTWKAGAGPDENEPKAGLFDLAEWRARMPPSPIWKEDLRRWVRWFSERRGKSA